MTATGGGSVTPDGTTTHDEDAEVTLTASWNDATHDFSWGGDCAGTTVSTCALTMDANKDVTATFTELPATRCATPTDADCTLAIYRGAPGDYTQAVDIPADVLLTAAADGRYRVERGQQVTVVTAASLPEGWTRFWLDWSPLEFGTPTPVSFSQLIQPVGTTYTFTPTEDETASTLITFELKQARPFIRPRPDGKPEIGAAVVTTVFRVVSCESGFAVTNPSANAELAEDCETLLALRDTLAGDAALNWSAGAAITSWTGVTVGGTPQRVTALRLANRGLSGQLSGLLGDLTALVELRLDDNMLTGPIPVNLGQLSALTHVYLANNALTGCVPASLQSVSNNDVGSLGLEDCSTGTYLDPVPEAIDVGEELTFGVITDVEAPSTIRIGPGAGNAAVSINEEACPSAPALSEGGGVSYHYRDDPRFRSSGAVYLRGCAAGTTEIHIYQGTTLLQSYPVRVTERTLVALSDGAAGELVLTWSDGTVGASTATGWQYRLRIWGREGDAPDGDAPRTWGEWTTIPGDGMVRRHRVTGLDEEWPYDFEVRPVTTAGPGLPSNIGEGVTARVGRDGIPRLNVPYLTATGFGWGGGVYGDQVLEGGRTYRLGDSDSVITIPAGMNMTVGLVGNDHLAGLIFSLEDVVTGNWVTLEFAFREVERSVAPVEDGGGSAPDPNTLFDQMLNSIRVQPEPPAGGE